MARKGLPKSIIKKYGITKKAWSVFKRGKGKKRKASSPKSGRYRKVARRRRKRRGGSRSFTLPLAPVAGLAAGLLSAPAGWASPVQAAMAGDIERAGNALVANYTGMDLTASPPTFDINKLKIGILPLIVGMVVHIVASKIGINRMLGRARIPFIRI